MLEHPPQLNITQSELKSHVSDYFDTLLAQRDAILERYGLTSETAEEFCNLHSTDEDRETILNLYEKMVFVIENKDVPPSELLVFERIKEQHRINEFFGTDADIEVPPLPPTITPERIEQWKQKRFELRYLPPLILEEYNEFPGWEKKPVVGFSLFYNLKQIQNHPRNQNNPHLINLTPNQLPGCWMLVDTRPKPNFHNRGEQIYEDDNDIQTIIQDLAQKGFVNQEAQGGRRNYIHPSTFENPAFWQPFYEYLGISKEEAIIRLPRVIEQSMFGQGIEWDGTSTDEWAEEYCRDERRLRGGSGKYGGVSQVSWNAFADAHVGFRCIVDFTVSQVDDDMMGQH